MSIPGRITYSASLGGLTFNGGGNLTTTGQIGISKNFLALAVVLVLVLWCSACSATRAVVRRNVAPAGAAEVWKDFDRNEWTFLHLTFYATEAPRPPPLGPIGRAVAQYAPAVKVGGWVSLAIGLAGILAACLFASNGAFARWFSWGVRLAVAGVGCWLLCLSLTTVLELWTWIVIIGGCLLAGLAVVEVRHLGLGKIKATVPQPKPAPAPPSTV